jgi:hypothetical protein
MATQIFFHLLAEDVIAVYIAFREGSAFYFRVISSPRAESP